MSNDIHLLKKTIQAEHAAVSKKESGIESRFEAAERLLKSNEKVRSLKPRVIKDTFTMPQSDHDKIGACLSRCLSLGIYSNKSEIIRAGLCSLVGLSDANFRKILKRQEKVKTGSPGKQL